MSDSNQQDMSFDDEYVIDFNAPPSIGDVKTVPDVADDVAFEIMIWNGTDWITWHREFTDGSIEEFPDDYDEGYVEKMLDTVETISDTEYARRAYDKAKKALGE